MVHLRQYKPHRNCAPILPHYNTVIMAFTSPVFTEESGNASAGSTGWMPVSPKEPLTPSICSWSPQLNSTVHQCSGSRPYSNSTSSGVCLTFEYTSRRQPDCTEASGGLGNSSLEGGREEITTLPVLCIYTYVYDTLEQCPKLFSKSEFALSTNLKN